MIEYLTENLWLLWTIIAMVCLILELSSGDFFVTCFAIGAICALISTLFGVPFWVQVIVFAVFSVLSILFVRPSLVKHIHSKDKERLSNADALIGREGIVIEPIEKGGSGYVKIDGDDWKAISKADEDILKGERVKVIHRESIIITVEKL
ncbi:MAG: NfeD family protein [Prevotella sp.]|jgi:membrane protein implicated in regulation of membrane protease activity|nr:NfeD family protein [Prevotella sp.]MCI1282850.1 NfeD family protein [Prevotella sp.]